MKNKKRNACGKISDSNPGNRTHIISQKEMVEHLQKMKKKGNVLTLQFDPLGYLYINGETQDEPADFLFYRKGTVYASINGTCHYAGKLDEHPRTVAAIQGHKFLSELDDEVYIFSSRKNPLPKDFSLLVLYRYNGAISLLAADGLICNRIQSITLAENSGNEFLLVSSFLHLLRWRNPRLADTVDDWYRASTLSLYSG